MAETLKRLYNDKEPVQAAQELPEVVTGAVENVEQIAPETAEPAIEAAPEPIIPEAAEVSEETVEAAKEAMQARAEDSGTGRRRRSRN